MEKTAVKWLFEQISECKDYTREELLEKAIEMEKNQIIKTFVDVTKENMTAFNISFGLKDIIDFKEIANIYYNEEFTQ